MEASTLKMKKQTIKKGKLKKTMKNVVCRPDPIFWPELSEEQSKTLEEVLNKYKVEIPIFKKPLWSELNKIPKEMRPKPPPAPKINGLMFGIGDCKKLIASKNCLGVLIEAGVNPKSIVQPLIELCTDKSIPVLCMKDLRRVTKINYGIPTSALGIQQNILPELEEIILELSECHKTSQKVLTAVDVETEIYATIEKSEEIMDIENKTSICPYLYRTNDKTRVFTPCVTEVIPKLSNKFVGQDFIELTNSIPKERTDRKQYMKMIVKKTSSNPNRRKHIKVSAED